MEDAITLAVCLKDAGPAAVELAKRMLGPIADELGLLGSDAIRTFRFKRAIAAIEKAAIGLHNAGIDPKSVRPGLLFPILEGASFEDDETLHDCWAGLLANAANPDFEDGVLPSFPEILKQLTPFEAKLLSKIYDDILEHHTRRDLNDQQTNMEMMKYGLAGIEYPVFDTMLKETPEVVVDNMERLGVFKRYPMSEDFGNTVAIFGMSAFGRRFVEACRGTQE